MPNQFQVVEPAATQGRTYTNSHGKELVVWNVSLKDEGMVELHRLPGNQPPAPSQVVLGRLEINSFKGQDEKRLYLEQGQGGGGSQRSSNSAGGDDPGRFDRKPEHPRNEARMLRNAALSTAPVLYDQLRTEGVIDKAESKAAYLETLAGIVKWIEDGTREAMNGSGA